MPSQYAAPAPVYPPPGLPYGKLSSETALVNSGLVPPRTPSPTQEEWDALHGPQGFARFKDKEFLMSKRGLFTLFTWVFITTIIVLTNVFNTQIVEALLPAGDWLRSHPAGFLIPIAILFVLSFPPLFGQEIVEMLIGLTYGLWVGFAITFVGRSLGELANFYVFKYMVGPRITRWRQKNGTVNFDFLSLKRVLNEGGFKIMVIIRYSAIPPHLATSLFAMSGLNVWSFLGALVLAAPKILVDVLLGVFYGLEAEDKEKGVTNDPSAKKYEILTYTVTGITVVVLIGAMRYIKRLQDKAKEEIIYERRKARQVKSFHTHNPSLDMVSAEDSV